MQFSYIFALFVAVGSVAAVPTPAGSIAPRALEGTTDDSGRLLRIFRTAAVKKDKSQLQNNRLTFGEAKTDAM
ncbi:hypothetical protein TWF718_003988 [Orbilia javanica]|uniref:RxLR effector protein n=1 Tax=Orbilia javanica TaxID=47235 RepID=A0AAN8RPZ8_9PEZI